MMRGKCPKCTKEYQVAGRRGVKLSDFKCRDCQVPLCGKNAGAVNARFRCPLERGVHTLGAGAVRLDKPHRVEYADPGWERLTWKADHYDHLKAMHGTVLGPGAVVAIGWMRLEPDPWWPASLVPLDDHLAGDPELWLVNEQLKYVRCKGCAAQLYDTDPRPDQPWTPVRASYTGSGRRWKETIAVRMGPHPANSPACPDCLPAVWATPAKPKKGTPCPAST